ASAAPVRAQDARQLLTGSWVGVYQSYPQFVHIALQVSPAAAGGDQMQAEGEMRLEPLVEQRSIVRGPLGVVRVMVTYDPLARTLLITPSAESARQIGAQLPQFSGVLDEETQVVGGVLVPAPRDASPYFVLARADKAPSLLKTLKDAANPSPAAT